MREKREKLKKTKGERPMACAGGYSPSAYDLMVALFDSQDRGCAVILWSVWEWRTNIDYVNDDFRDEVLPRRRCWAGMVWM